MYEVEFHHSINEKFFGESGRPALFLIILASSSVAHAVASDLDKNVLLSENSRLRTIACHEEPLLRMVAIELACCYFVTNPSHLYVK